MFFIFSKIVYWFIMPVSLISFCLLASIIIKKTRIRKLLRNTGIGLLLFFSNPFFAKLIINFWEQEHKLYADLDRVYDYGIVLGGITVPDRAPYDRIQFSKGADRIIHTLDLYKLGKIKKIVISGGSGTLIFEGKPESIMIKNFVLSTGVPPEDIITDQQSRNTRENALFSSQLVNDSSDILLITSAFHMFRAKACFEKEGIKCDIFPTDYLGGPIRWSPGDIIVPSLYALEIWSKLIKEWIGIGAYKIADYI